MLHSGKIAQGVKQAKGHGMRGHKLQWHKVQGHKVQGHKVQGHKVQGHKVQGHKVQGHKMSIGTSGRLAKQHKVQSSPSVKNYNNE
jgi:hypothetical protein